jgi:hypothetical protein
MMTLHYERVGWTIQQVGKQNWSASVSQKSTHTGLSGGDEMGEQADDTTEHDGSSALKRDQDERGYYYDDDTGYEVYDPEKDDDEEEEPEKLEE